MKLETKPLSDYLISAIIVSVGFAKELKISLSTNRKHFSRAIIVTSYQDEETRTIAEQFDCIVYRTNSFYRDGAIFNKGAAIEEGFDVAGRCGWLLVLDADIVLPEQIEADLHVGNLYAPHARIEIPKLKDFDGFDFNKKRKKKEFNRRFIGYFQLFHAADPVLSSYPWYDTTWISAARSDACFSRKWCKEKRVHLDFEVCHLGALKPSWLFKDRPDIQRRFSQLKKKYGQRIEKL